MRHLLSIGVCMFISCNGLQKDGSNAFIPGMYVKVINNEFATGGDTLVISVLNFTAGSYLIDRSTGYLQQIDGRVLSPQHKKEKWIAIYDATTLQLVEQRKGKAFSFLPEQGKLLIGSSEYEKVKD